MRSGERATGPGRGAQPGEPSEPRPAASVVLLRRGGKHGDRALEVLLLKRTAEARFMPNVWVFPGGAVDAGGRRGRGRLPGLRACASWPRRRGSSSPADEELVLFSRWITPEVVSTRFDAWFFLALAPAHTPPQPDGVETVEAAWFEPRAALEAPGGRRDRRSPSRPISQLECAAPVRAPPTRRSPPTATATVEPILPKVIGTPRSTGSSCPATPTTRPEPP